MLEIVVDWRRIGSRVSIKTERSKMAMARAPPPKRQRINASLLKFFLGVGGTFFGLREDADFLCFF